MIAGLVALKAFMRRLPSAPLLLLFQVAVLSLFAEPAIGAYETSGFGKRVFGEAMQLHVPSGETVIVLGITKAHAIRLFGGRRIEFAEEAADVRPMLEDGKTRFVVTRKKDGKRMARLQGMESVLLEKEPGREKDKAFLLYSVREAIADGEPP